MKILFLVMMSFLSVQAIANECAKELAPEIHKVIAKKMKLSPNTISVRYLGGETMDSDSTSDGKYLEPAQEFYDVFSKDKSKAALNMFLAETYKLTDEETGEVACELGDVNEVEQSEWENIYDIYL